MSNIKKKTKNNKNKKFAADLRNPKFCFFCTWVNLELFLLLHTCSNFRRPHSVRESQRRRQ